MLLRGMTEARRKEDVVTKLMSSERMSRTAALKEMVAALMARQLGIVMPEPCFVDIDQEFVATVDDEQVNMRLGSSLGLNFATVNVVGLQAFTTLTQLRNDLRDEALKVFYFDLLVQNADRTVTAGGKANLFTNRNHLCILDHELAFSFLEMLLPMGSPYELSRHDRESLAGKHILFEKLKGLRLNFPILEGFLDTLDTHFWNHVVRVVPSNWQGAEMAKIRSHVKEVRDHQPEFIALTTELLK